MTMVYDLFVCLCFRETNNPTPPNSAMRVIIATLRTCTIPSVYTQTESPATPQARAVPLTNTSMVPQLHSNSGGGGGMMNEM